MDTIKDSKYIGMKIKLRREVLGISQEKLGEMVGVTYQQIQKYEKGINKVNSEMLQKVANSLDVNVDFFFKDRDEEIYKEAKESTGVKEVIEGVSSAYQYSSDLSSEERELIECFRAIADKEYRKCFLSLLRLSVKPGT
ncbi:MAG: helix-turn-helix domain-containing protein [Deltaproteobacteria bacterium]|jgi:transcriptional regulator with XRE-family HTH domain|nr:MAG: helix-turn-helix domain-containing protein [Deltaproteobacteria bacterium]